MLLFRAALLPMPCLRRARHVGPTFRPLGAAWTQFRGYCYESRFKYREGLLGNFLIFNFREVNSAETMIWFVFLMGGGGVA